MGFKFGAFSVIISVVMLLKSIKTLFPKIIIGRR